MVLRRGFALTVALLLMSFLLMLTLSLTTMVRLEMGTASSALKKLHAKESARLALMLALGDLQKHAGPDQRATARAEILENGIGDLNPYWTGVWDTTNPTARPHWLVSRNDQPKSPGSGMLRLVGPATVGSHTDFYVEAPSIKILDKESGLLTEIAWWISDEGVKASLRMEDRIDRLDASCFADYTSSGLTIAEQKQMLRQCVPSRHRTEVFTNEATMLVPLETEDITQPGVQQRIQEAQQKLRRTLSLKQAELLDGIEKADWNQCYHDLSFLAEGVLSDTKRGGLKKDLSDPNFDDPSGAIPVGKNLRKFLWQPSLNSDESLELRGITSAELEKLETGSIVPTTPPILSEFSLYFAVFGESSSSSTARAFLAFEAEVWSPYGFRHEFSGKRGSNTPELFIEFSGLPEIELKFYDNDQRRFTNSTTLDLNTLKPNFRLDLTNTHKSGEIRKTPGIWPANKSSRNNHTTFYYTDDWSWEIDDPSIKKHSRKKGSIYYTAPNSRLQVTLKNESGGILQRIENLPIGAIETDSSFFPASPSELEKSDAPIVFYYQLRDDRNALECWLTKIDPRSVILDLNESSLLELVDFNDLDQDGYGDADMPDTNTFTDQDLFNGQINNNYFRLFDVPTTIPISVGILQHLNLKDKPPYSIGNSWGGDCNGVFDQYFLSGIPQENKPSEKVLSESIIPNPALRLYSEKGTLPYEEVTGSDTAQHLLVSGSFNINSTSVDAWQAVLSSNYIYNWEYSLNRSTSIEEKDSRLNLEGCFFRLPFSGHYRSEGFTKWKFPFEKYEEETNGNDDYPALLEEEKEDIFRKSNEYNPIQDWRPSLAIGHREIPKPQIKELANSIVSTLKARGRAFHSIEEFVNSGILQASIDETSINTIVNGSSYSNADTSEKLPRNAPAYLSQADILSALAPYISARSDTFKIHAKAITKNPATGTVLAQAGCIARVQRVPTRVDDNTSAIMENAKGFGRRFIITDFQWTTSTEQ